MKHKIPVSALNTMFNVIILEKHDRVFYNLHGWFKRLLVKITNRAGNNI